MSDIVRTVTQAGPADGGDFGPLTPGTTTAGIQEALNALPTGRTTKATVVLSGNLEVMDGVLVPSYSRVVIQGTVRAAAHCRIPAGHGVFTNAGAPSPSSQDYDIEIAGGRVDANRAQNTTAFEGVILDGVVGGVIREVDVANAPENGIGAGASNALPTAVDIISCVAHGCAQDGIVANDGGHVRILGGAAYDNVTGLEIVNDNGGIDVADSATIVGGGFRAYGNTSAGITVETQGGAVAPHDVAIEATVYGNGMYGLQVLAGRRITLDVTAVRNGYSGVLISGVNDLRGRVTAYDNAQAHDANFENRSGVLVRSSSHVHLDVRAGDDQAAPTQGYGLGLEANLPGDLADSSFTVAGEGNVVAQFAAIPNTGTFAESVAVSTQRTGPMPPGGIVVPALAVIGAGLLWLLMGGRNG